MNQGAIADLFAEFLRGYDAEAKDALWQQQSKAFREFWISRVIGGGSGELADSEIDEIVRILDRNAKGNTKASEAVARAMIAQGAWRRIFNQIKKNPKLAGSLNEIFLERDKAKRAAAIDQLFPTNAATGLPFRLSAVGLVPLPGPGVQESPSPGHIRSSVKSAWVVTPFRTTTLSRSRGT
jgi:hypothetical protein